MQSPGRKQTDPAALADPLRLQVAAVAAQQIAVHEHEINLAERRAAQEQQDEQLIASLDEKRRQLLLEGDRVEAERAALEQERLAYDRHVAFITRDLAQPQRDLLAAEKQVTQERRRLAGLYQKMKLRWHRHWKIKQRRLLQGEREQARRAELLEARLRKVAEGERELRVQNLRFNGDAALARQNLKEAWSELRQAQDRWKHRRGLERAALKIRARDLDSTAQQIAHARKQLAHDQRSWHEQRQALDIELEGVNARIEHQRQVMNQQQTLLLWLEDQIYRREQSPALLPTNAAQPSQASADGAAPDAGLVAPPPLSPLSSTARSLVVLAKDSHLSPATPPGVVQRVVDLDQLTEELADQRAQLVEAWGRLAALHDQWQDEKLEAVTQLEAHGQRLLERDLSVQAHEQAGAQTDDVLRGRRDELSRLQHELIAWRARLRIEETAWEADKDQLVTELQGKQALAEQQLKTLIELRQRWTKRRKREVEELHNERSTLETFRQEIARLRQELLQRGRVLEDEKRILAEKTLALEQFRNDTLVRVSDDPQAERRLERLRRRWLTHNAETIRNTAREREALQSELSRLEERYEAMQRRAADIAQIEAELIEKQTAWEHRQMMTTTRHSRLEHDLENAEAQRRAAEEQLAGLRDEVERIARGLLDEPDLPRSLAA